MTTPRVRRKLIEVALPLDAINAAAAREKFYEGHRVLDPEDVAAAVLFALDAPAHVNIGLIEMTPVGQVPGGIAFPEEPSPP